MAAAAWARVRSPPSATVPSNPGQPPASATVVAATAFGSLCDMAPVQLPRSASAHYSHGPPGHRRWPIAGVGRRLLTWTAVTRVDWTIVRTAATGGLILIVPSAVVASRLLGPAPAGRLVVGLPGAGPGRPSGVAGFVAGRLRPDTPMLHGALGAGLAFVAAQAFGLVLTALRDEPISWVAVPLTALLAVSVGVAGALASDLVHRRAVRAAGGG